MLVWLKVNPLLIHKLYHTIVLALLSLFDLIFPKIKWACPVYLVGKFLLFSLLFTFLTLEAEEEDPEHIFTDLPTLFPLEWMQFCDETNRLRIDLTFGEYLSSHTKRLTLIDKLFIAVVAVWVEPLLRILFQFHLKVISFNS